MKVLKKHEKQLSDHAGKQAKGKHSEGEVAGRIAAIKQDHSKELLALDKKLLHEVCLEGGGGGGLLKELIKGY